MVNQNLTKYDFQEEISSGHTTPDKAHQEHNFPPMSHGILG